MGIAMRIIQLFWQVVLIGLWIYALLSNESLLKTLGWVTVALSALLFILEIIAIILSLGKKRKRRKF